MKIAIVLGAGGFIGGHLVKKLKKEGYWVRGVDIKHHEHDNIPCDEFMQGDLRDFSFCEKVLTVKESIDEVYQLAADMGGAGYIFTGDHDYDVMINSALINLNISRVLKIIKAKKVFYSSSACIYPERNQLDPNNPICSEESAYPADPDSEYGWEKLFSERMWKSFQRDTGVDVKIARFHNIYGPMGTWTGGKEKAPASMCRKVAECEDGGEIEVWGTGQQTRSFLYIDECLEGVRRLMNSDCDVVINIGSEEMVSINQLANIAIKLSGKDIKIKNVKTNALGVIGRNSDNRLIKEKLGWEPNYPLIDGMTKTYEWINEQVKKNIT